MGSRLARLLEQVFERKQRATAGTQRAAAIELVPRAGLDQVAPVQARTRSTVNGDRLDRRERRRLGEARRARAARATVRWGVKRTPLGPERRAERRVDREREPREPPASGRRPRPTARALGAGWGKLAEPASPGLERAAAPRRVRRPGRVHAPDEVGRSRRPEEPQRDVPAVRAVSSAPRGPRLARGDRRRRRRRGPPPEVDRHEQPHRRVGLGGVRPRRHVDPQISRSGGQRPALEVPPHQVERRLLGPSAHALAVARQRDVAARVRRRSSASSASHTSPGLRCRRGARGRPRPSAPRRRRRRTRRRAPGRHLKRARLAHHARSARSSPAATPEHVALRLRHVHDGRATEVGRRARDRWSAAAPTPPPVSDSAQPRAARTPRSSRPTASSSASSCVGEHDVPQPRRDHLDGERVDQRRRPSSRGRPSRSGAPSPRRPRRGTRRVGFVDGHEQVGDAAPPPRDSPMPAHRSDLRPHDRRARALGQLGQDRARPSSRASRPARRPSRTAGVPPGSVATSPGAVPRSGTTYRAPSGTSAWRRLLVGHRRRRRTWRTARGASPRARDGGPSARPSPARSRRA